MRKKNQRSRLNCCTENENQLALVAVAVELTGKTCLPHRRVMRTTLRRPSNQPRCERLGQSTGRKFRDAKTRPCMLSGMQAKQPNSQAACVAIVWRWLEAWHLSTCPPHAKKPLWHNTLLNGYLTLSRSRIQTTWYRVSQEHNQTFENASPAPVASETQRSSVRRDLAPLADSPAASSSLSTMVVASKPKTAPAAPAAAAPSSSAWIGYVAMALLAVQFGLQPILFKEFASNVKHSSVLVIACEGFKLLLALLTLLSSGSLGRVAKNWTLRESLAASGLPACTYAVQNVLIQVAYQHLPSIVFNLLNQTKLLWSALFIYALIGTKYSLAQCLSMLTLLGAAMLLSLSKDSSKGEGEAAELSVEFGLVPVLLASMLSGLGAAITQRSMQQHKRDAALVTMELSLYGSVFLVMPAVWSTITKTPTDESPALNALQNMDAVFEGCDVYTLIPVLSNACGGLLVGAVTKHVGGVLKSFALICGIAFTALVESVVYGAVLPNEVFIAAGLVAFSMVVYSSFPYVPKAPKAKTE